MGNDSEESLKEPEAIKVADWDMCNEVHRSNFERSSKKVPPDLKRKNNACDMNVIFRMMSRKKAMAEAQLGRGKPKRSKNKSSAN